MALVADDGNVVDPSTGGRDGRASGHGSPGRKLPLGLADPAARERLLGTLGPLTHDVGIVALPAGRGDVAVAVLVGSDAALAARERLIAGVARAVWDRFAS